jgi:hypothetical protein
MEAGSSVGCVESISHCVHVECCYSHDTYDTILEHSAKFVSLHMVLQGKSKGKLNPTTTNL